MVILLIGILAAVVLPKFINLTGSANKAASQGIVGSLGEGLTTQLSKNLVNNDLSSYVTVTGASTSAAGTVTLANDTAFKAGASGGNPYVNPFLLLPNYTIATSANNGKGTGTTYNFGKATSPGTSNSWWMYYAKGTASGPGKPDGSVTATVTCDNSATTNPNYLAPTITVPNNEYILQLGNVDYIYSNGTTVDSYVYYMAYSINDNIDGFYMVPCQS
jgi:MSHA pilin protein MshA